VPYEVHLDVYDGPFDLLLQLITAQQLEIYEIRLSDIVDAFITELGRLESVDLELATEFLLIAATLVELKCKRLLPGSDEVDIDDDLSLYEARDYLLARLVEAKMFAAAGAALAHVESEAARAHARRTGADERFADVEPDLLAGVTPERLARLAVAALTERPVEAPDISHLLADEVSVADTLEMLVATLPAKGRTTFRELTAATTSTAGFVACFLALLELYKQALVDLDQPTRFGDLTVQWIGGEDAALQTNEDYDGAGAGR
jgi:segregation and condensation protein A